MEEIGWVGEHPHRDKGEEGGEQWVAGKLGSDAALCFLEDIDPQQMEQALSIASVSESPQSSGKPPEPMWFVGMTGGVPGLWSGASCICGHWCHHSNMASSQVLHDLETTMLKPTQERYLKFLLKRWILVGDATGRGPPKSCSTLPGMCHGGHMHDEAASLRQPLHL